MSRCMFTQLLCCRSRFGAHGGSATTAAVLTSKNVLRHITQPTVASHRNGSDKPVRALGQTTILVQQGGEIQELPVIMRKIGHDDITAMCASSALPQSLPDAPSQPLLINNTNDNTAFRPQCDADKIIQRLKAADDGLLSLLAALDELSDDEFRTPDVTKYALNRIMRIVSADQLVDLELIENGTLTRLVDAFALNGETQSLLDAMKTMPTFNSIDSTPQSMTRICDELLTRSSQDCLTVVEICECIDRFVACNQTAAADKFWSALSDQDQCINENNIKFIYRILSKLRVSRRMVMGVLERRIRSVFWKMTPDAVVDVVRSLVTCNVSSARTLQTISRWLNTNIHAVSEAHLNEIIVGFTTLDYSDDQLEKALERYIKAKGIKIQQHDLVANVLCHCSKYRLRNSHILNGCSEFFIVNATLLDPILLRTIFCSYGQLNYQPINGVRFWKTMENYIEQHFDRLTPSDTVDIMLTCVHLGKYPLNFVRRIFNPYFLDQMHSRTPLNLHPKLRSDLKLFDTAMCIECTDYNGPLLPRDHSAKSVWQDGRIKRLTQNLSDLWTQVAGGVDQFSKHVVPQQLPFNPLYIIDVLIHPAGMGQLWNFNVHTDRNVYAAVLIHLPEHYDSTGEHLSGAQTMRIRHMRHLGLKVVQLDFEQLNKLRVHSVELRDYVVEQMRSALPATG